MGDSTAERGGRAKEFIKVTIPGQAAYNYTCRVQTSMIELSGAAGSYA